MRRAVGGNSIASFLKQSKAHHRMPMQEWCRRLSSLRGTAERGKSPDERAAREALWLKFLSDPSQWWDSRSNKKRLKYPDFVHSTTREGLWLDSSLNPLWVEEVVANLREARAFGAYRASFRLDKGPGCGDDGDNSVRLPRTESSFDLGRWSNLCQKGRLDEAFQALDLMWQRGSFVSTDMLYRMLKGCIAKKDAVVGRLAHDLIAKCGYDSNSFLANHVIHMYVSHGSLQEARQVFRKFSTPTVFMWTSIISAHTELGEAEEAIKLYREVRQLAVEMDGYLFVAALKACAKAGDLVSGKLVHADAMDSGVESSVFVGNSLVDMYAKCGSLVEARQVFDRLSARNVVTWTCMIGGYVQGGLDEEALQLYVSMEENGVQPDNVTFVSILRACGNAECIHMGMRIHEQISDKGIESDVSVANALIDMYAKCKRLEDARRVFDRLPNRDMASWNCMLAGYAQDGLALEALQLYEGMQESGIIPDSVTFVSMLKVCGSVGAIREGKQLHSLILEKGYEAEGFIGNALVDMYAKCGSLEAAQAVFHRLARKDVRTWTALINGYGLHNNCRRAMQYFEDMKQQGVEPDAALFSCLIVACSHVGFVQEGQQYFKSMVEDYGITPGIEHYTCVVDLLARSGHLSEAETVWRCMPYEQDSVGWMSLLSACKIYGNMELGKLCFDQLVQMEPHTASGYSLMGAIYAGAGRWDDVAAIESLRKSAGAYKKPAKASIEVDNKMHEFVVGEKRDDTSAKLKSLSVHLEHWPIQPQDSQAVSVSVSEEEEDALCGHAEKLALAYGLLNTPDGSTLLVTKNLRMCSHCHSGTKIISRMEGREIIVRDAHRVHHFKDGSCSCGDDR